MRTAPATDNTVEFRQINHATNSRDADLISKTIDQVVAPDVLIRTPLPIEATEKKLARLHQAVPDLQTTTDDPICAGDKIVRRNTVTGTHHSEYMGLPPTGKTVAHNEMFIVRFAGGRIVEAWGIVDVLSQMKQRGVIQQQRPLHEANIQ